jgi:hypothetical protein
MSDGPVNLQIQVAAKLQVPKTFHIVNKNDKLQWKIKQHRQAWHMEVPTVEFEETKILIVEGKAMEGMVESVYNKHTIISNVITKSTQQRITRVLVRSC